MAYVRTFVTSIKGDQREYTVTILLTALHFEGMGSGEEPDAVTNASSEQALQFSTSQQPTIKWKSIRFVLSNWLNTPGEGRRLGGSLGRHHLCWQGFMGRDGLVDLSTCRSSSLTCRVATCRQVVTCRTTLNPWLQPYKLQPLYEATAHVICAGYLARSVYCSHVRSCTTCLNHAFSSCITVISSSLCLCCFDFQLGLKFMLKYWKCFAYNLVWSMPKTCLSKDWSQ